MILLIIAVAAVIAVVLAWSIARKIRIGEAAAVSTRLLREKSYQPTPTKITMPTTTR